MTLERPKMLVLGIDPGINGAIASYDGSDFISVFDIPKMKSKGAGEEINWVLLAAEFKNKYAACTHAYIENVQSRPGEGRSSGFKFGYAAGGLRAMTAFCGIPITMVTPSSWKLAMGLNSDKDYSRTKATELFPFNAHEFARKKDNNKAEAALLAYYGFNKLKGMK